MDTREVRSLLEEEKDEKYRLFSQSLLPGVDNLMGVRLPSLRKLAKTIAAGDYEEFFRTNRRDYFEEIMLEGLVIGYLDLELEEALKLVAGFLPRIYNWSICDSFSSNLDLVKKNRTAFLDFLRPYFKSSRPYEVRFGLVILLNYYVDSSYLEEVFSIFRSLKPQDYYVKMGLAWALSRFFVDYPQEVFDFLANYPLDKFSHNKALEKIRQSRRVSREWKKKIEALKIN